MEAQFGVVADHYPSAAPKNKATFTCPRCEQTAWGKPDLALICKPCGVEMPRMK
jgi:hypothetical protein